MADENRWNDERDREWRERYRRGERRYGAGDFEQGRHGRYYDMPDDRDRRWPDYDPGHDSPAYHDRGARASWGGVDDRARERENRDFAGWDAPFGGKPIGDHEHGAWDRLMQEGRSFFDRTRGELSALFRSDDHHAGPAASARPRDDFRGCGPRNYRRSDERILDEVNERLTDDPRLDASRIDVKVAGGEVTLDGLVRTRSDKRRAEDLVDRVSGVGHVQNNLRADQETGVDSGDAPPII